VSPPLVRSPNYHPQTSLIPEMPSLIPLPPPTHTHTPPPHTYTPPPPQKQVRSTWELLTSEFNPLELCTKLDPLLASISALQSPMSAASPVKDLAMRQYTTPLKQVRATGLCPHCSAVLVSPQGRLQSQRVAEGANTATGFSDVQNQDMLRPPEHSPPPPTPPGSWSWNSVMCLYKQPHVDTLLLLLLCCCRRLPCCAC
jgi:hypothetical protein